jgi:hypothetical protein
VTGSDKVDKEVTTAHFSNTKQHSTGPSMCNDMPTQNPIQTLHYLQLNGVGVVRADVGQGQQILAIGISIAQSLLRNPCCATNLGANEEVAVEGVHVQALRHADLCTAVGWCESVPWLALSTALFSLPNHRGLTRMTASMPMGRVR